MPSQSLDTFELNAGVTWKWVSYKLSVSTGDYFGVNTSTGYSKRKRGTMYHDAGWAHVLMTASGRRPVSMFLDRTEQ